MISWIAPVLAVAPGVPFGIGRHVRCKPFGVPVLVHDIRAGDARPEKGFILRYSADAIDRGLRGDRLFPRL